MPVMSRAMEQFQETAPWKIAVGILKAFWPSTGVFQRGTCLFRKIQALEPVSHINMEFGWQVPVYLDKRCCRKIYRKSASQCYSRHFRVIVVISRCPSPTKFSTKFFVWLLLDLTFVYKHSADGFKFHCKIRCVATQQEPLLSQLPTKTSQPSAQAQVSYLRCETSAVGMSRSWWCPPCEWRVPFPWRRRWSEVRQRRWARRKAARVKSTQCPASLLTTAAGCQHPSL